MLRILMGRAKTGKSDLILQEIKRLGDSGKQILLVPEHASYQAERDLCRVCGDTVSRHAEVLSFQRLCNRVLSRTGGLAKGTLDAGGRLLMLQTTLMETAPVLKVYRHPSQRAAFLKNMLDLFDEFRAYGVTPQCLMEETEHLGGETGKKLYDLSLLYAGYEEKIFHQDCDARDCVSKLCDLLEPSGYVRGADVFVDGFAYFTANELRVLQIMLKEAHSVTVVLLGDDGANGEIFETAIRVREQLLRIADEVLCDREVVLVPPKTEPLSELDHLERYFFGDTKVYEGTCRSIRIREADTLYSEVEQTAAEIRKLVAGGACRYRDITVAARNMADYEGYIESVFRRYEIPVYMSRRTDILEKPLLSFLNSVLTSVSSGYEYEDMFQWLKTGLAGVSAEECDLLENYVLKWDIHGRMWLNDVDWTENPDGYGIPLNRDREERLQKVNELRKRIREPLIHLENGLKSLETISGKVNTLYGFLEDLNLQSALEQQIGSLRKGGWIQEAEETVQLWDLLGSVLDQMERLIGEREMGMDLFIQLFRQMVSGTPVTIWSCWEPTIMCCLIPVRAAEFSMTMTVTHWQNGASDSLPAEWNG